MCVRSRSPLALGYFFPCRPFPLHDEKPELKQQPTDGPANCHAIYFSLCAGDVRFPNTDLSLSISLSKVGFGGFFSFIHERERGKSETQLAAVKQGGGGGEKGPFLLLLLSLQIRRRRSQDLLRGALYEFPTFLFQGRKSVKAPNFDLFFGFFLSYTLHVLLSPLFSSPCNFRTSPSMPSEE